MYMKKSRWLDSSIRLNFYDIIVFIKNCFLCFLCVYILFFLFNFYIFFYFFLLHISISSTDRDSLPFPSFPFYFFLCSLYFSVCTMWVSVLWLFWQPYMKHSHPSLFPNLSSKPQWDCLFVSVLHLSTCKVTARFFFRDSIP